MFQTYAMIGKKFKVGNVSALGLLIFSFCILGCLGAWWVLSEIESIGQIPGWIKVTSSAALGLLGQWMMGRFLYRPLPRYRFPEAQPKVQEDRSTRFLVGLPFRHMDGFRRKGLLEGQAWES